LEELLHEFWLKRVWELPVALRCKKIMVMGRECDGWM
jgi:hypothetical protein